VEDVLLAYPSADRDGYAELAADPKLAASVTVMVDDPAQLRLIEEARGPGAEEIRVCLELDTSLLLLGGRVRVGARRSPLHSPADVAELARTEELVAAAGQRLAATGRDATVAGR
ncbi:alanine racemase, partial [Streptomyces sp. NRRL F-6602]